jgi:NADPH:quinone reductase-like Zn-dependent oxidoreductase
MRAAICTRYGPPEVVRLVDLPTPMPRADELVVRVHATTVSSGDWRVRSLDLPRGFGPVARLAFGLRRPRQPILGTELSGVVTAVGSTAAGFAVGDEVVAFTGAKMGCHAELVRVPAGGAIVPKPSNLSHAQAATLGFGGTTAADFLRRGHLQAGERILINGASGTVGIALVQLAANLGATVTAVCSTRNMPLMHYLGAHHVVDYTTTDFAALDTRYDVIADTAGTAPYARSRHALTSTGRLLLINADLGEMLRAPWITRRHGHRVVAGPAAERRDDLAMVTSLASAGRFTPVIDRCYPLDEIVAAHRHVDTGHKRGSVVVEMM